MNKRWPVSSCLTLFKSWLRSAKAAARDDAGVALVAIVFVLGSAALATTTMVLLQEQGIPLELRNTRSQNSSIELVNDALEVYIIQNDFVPCPANGDTGDGMALTNCDDNDQDRNAGEVPWATLGLSEQDATDAYGNIYTYVAATNLATGGTVAALCEQIGGEVSGVVNSGNIQVDTDNDMTDTADITTAIYAVIGHGENRRGGWTTNDNYTGVPGTLEDNNSAGAAGVVNLALINDFPPAEGDANSVFDDLVVVKQPSDFTEFCEDLVAEGDVNNFLEVDFQGGDSDITDNFAVSGTAAIVDGTGGDDVAQLTDDTVLTTSTQFPVDLAPTYISVEWTPTSGTDGGLSIVTRTGGGTPTAPDTYNNGITFRFWQESLGPPNIGPALSPIPNTISILCTSQCGTTTLVGGTILELDATYLVEVYDDGARVWGRITEIADPTNRLVIYDTSENVIEDVTSLTNSVAFLNVDDSPGSSGFESQIDDVLVARSMGAVSFDGTNDYIFVNDGAQRDEFNLTGDMTMELWVRPTGNPSAGDALISKYDAGGTPADDQSYLLAWNTSANALELALVNNTGTEVTCTSGINPTIDEWTHVAFVFNTASSGSITFYENGVQSGSCSSVGITDINDSGTDFRIGASDNTGIVNYFEGDVVEFRIWDVARNANDILANYRTRLFGDQSTNGLRLLWEMDVDDTSTPDTDFAGDDALCSTNVTVYATGGTVSQDCSSNDAGVLDDNSSTAAFIGADERFRLPFADDVCPGNEDGLFSCQYEGAGSTFSTSAIPVNLTNVIVTMWGGGGGSADNYGVSPSRNAGGGGGYGRGRVPSIGSTPITQGGTQVLFVTVGAGGAAGTGNNGGAGGGASSLRLTNAAGTIGMVGGGGGAGNGNAIDFSGGGVNDDDCDDVDDSDLCGSGGGGGGANQNGLAGPDSAEGTFPAGPGDQCGGNAATTAMAGAASNEANDTLCENAGQAGGTGTQGDGGGTVEGGGGSGDGSGGSNNADAGGGGFYGGGAGAEDTVAGDDGFGGGGGSGIVDGDIETVFAEQGETGGTTEISTPVFGALPGGVNDGDASTVEVDSTSDGDYLKRTPATFDANNTFALCTSSGLRTPGRDGESVASGGGEAGCNGAVIIQW